VKKIKKENQIECDRKEEIQKHDLLEDKMSFGTFKLRI
jgi:hypothetical protein